MNPALIRAAALAYHVKEKALAAALEVTPTVDRAWASAQGFPDDADPNTDANRAHLVARALVGAPPGWLTTKIAAVARELGHAPRTRDVWKARWWTARKW